MEENFKFGVSLGLNYYMRKTVFSFLYVTLTFFDVPCKLSLYELLTQLVKGEGDQYRRGIDNIRDYFKVRNHIVLFYSKLHIVYISIYMFSYNLKENTPLG